jgi:hypothetical protein
MIDCTTCSEPLHLAYDRYIEIQGERAIAQKLFVPGLEPLHIQRGHRYEAIPPLPDNTEYKVWRASNMYFKNGIEVKRKGKFEGDWTDQKKWDRTIWKGSSSKNGTKVKTETNDQEFHEQPAGSVVAMTESLTPSNRAPSPGRPYSFKQEEKEEEASSPSTLAASSPPGSDIRERAVVHERYPSSR